MPPQLVVVDVVAWIAGQSPTQLQALAWASHWRGITLWWHHPWECYVVGPHLRGEKKGQ